MCVEGVGTLVMQDEKVQLLLSDPRMDVIHKQVVMTLYSLDIGGRLAEVREVLPLYLSMEWSACREILETIERVGLVSLVDGKVSLTYPISPDHGSQECLCHV
jgi:hypothetical protein